MKNMKMFGVFVLFCLCALPGMAQTSIGDGDTVPSNTWASEREQRIAWQNADILNQDMNPPYGEWVKNEPYLGEVHANVRCGLTLKYHFYVEVRFPGTEFFEPVLRGPVTFDQPGVYVLRDVENERGLIVIRTDCY